MSAKQPTVTIRPRQPWDYVTLLDGRELGPDGIKVTEAEAKALLRDYHTLQRG